MTELIDADLKAIRDAIETADLAKLGKAEQRNAKYLLDSWTNRIRDLAMAIAKGEEQRQIIERARLRELAAGFADVIALLSLEQRSLAATELSKVFAIAGDVADSGIRYAADVAISALAGAAIKAFAGSR